MDELREPQPTALFLRENLVTAVMVLPVCLLLKDDSCICFVDVL